MPENQFQQKTENQNKKILVTGGAGFIGSHLVEALLKRGDFVVCVDNFNDFYHPGQKELNVAPFLNNPNFKLLDLAKEFGIKHFIFASSSSIYGKNNKVPFSENDNVDFPMSPYAAT